METIQQIRCGTVNCFLVRNERAAVLVDTGRIASRETVLRACVEVPLRLIVLTHGHVDHVQNAFFLSRELHVPIAMHREDLPLLMDNRQQQLFAHRLLGKFMLSATNRSFRKDRIPPFSPDILLEDGDSLSLYGIDGKVIALPGHTRGSIGLAVGEGALLVGDAMMNLPWPCPSLLYNNRVMMLRSVQKIRSLLPATVYFGHGRPAQLKLKSDKQELLSR